MEDILQDEIVKLEGELTKLRSAVEYIETAKISIEAASKIINTIIKLKEEFDRLSEKAYVLIDKFDKLEIPSRLDKIDSKIDSGISTLHNQLEALQPRIEAGYKTVVLETKALSKNISSEMGDSRNKILNSLAKQSKDIKLIYFSVIGAFALAFIVGVLFYLKVI
jgi:tetrahydromethanopterin S-methyltransferase subunit G